MDQLQFNKIISEIKLLIDRCGKICVHSTEELKSLSLEEVFNRIEEAKSIQGDMDRLFQYELYHLIGMGDLNTCQILTLVSNLKYLLMFRPYVKPLASSTINLVKIPDNKECEYMCKTLNVKLTSVAGKI